MDGNPIFCDCDLKMRALNPSFYKQFNDLNKVICANDQHQNKTVDVYLEELNCGMYNTIYTMNAQWMTQKGTFFPQIIWKFVSHIEKYSCTV